MTVDMQKGFINNDTQHVIQLVEELQHPIRPIVLSRACATNARTLYHNATLSILRRTIGEHQVV